MKSRLEDFIKQHRREFNTEIPDMDVWTYLQAFRCKKKKSVYHLFWTRSAAAAALILVGLSIFSLLLNKKNTNSEDINPETVIVQSSDYKGTAFEKEFIEINNAIQAKQSIIREMESVNPDLYLKFTVARSKLNELYVQLEKELDNNLNEGELLEKMIQNLTLQLKLLNRQLIIIQKIKQAKVERDI